MIVYETFVPCFQWIAFTARGNLLSKFNVPIFVVATKNMCDREELN